MNNYNCYKVNSQNEENFESIPPVTTPVSTQPFGQGFPFNATTAPPTLAPSSGYFSAPFSGNNLYITIGAGVGALLLIIFLIFMFTGKKKSDDDMMFL